MGSNTLDAKMKPIMDDLGSQNKAKEEDDMGMDTDTDTGMDTDSDTDTKVLFSPRNGYGDGVLKGPTKSKRKVHWNDFNGNRLAQVLEFVPSDASDSDDDDADSCFCTIM